MDEVQNTSLALAMSDAQEIEATFAFKESLHVTPYVTPEESTVGTPTGSRKRGPYGSGAHFAGLQFTL